MKTQSPKNRKLSKWIVLIFLFAFFQNVQAQNPVLKVYEDWNTTSGTQNMFQRSVTRSVPGTSNVVIAGATVNSNGDYDIFVQKISGSGAVLWSAQYNGVGNGDDVATDIRVASNGEIYVCGAYYKDATDSSNAIVIKYDANGNQRWTSVYNGGGSRNDGYASMLVSGNSVVAVGTCWSTSNQYDMLTRRLDTAGTTIWTTTADNAGLADGAISLSARTGFLFVAGGVQSTSTSYKMATWKINPTTGAISTTTLSSSAPFGIDLVADVQEDASGNVYVAGSVFDVATGFDYKLFKYDVNLALLWSATWNGAANLDDGITGLALDQYGKVIVTGYTTTAQGKDFATVKYSSAGVLQWASTFDGGGNDSATCIVVSSTDTNKIYISGYSYSNSTNDYLTLRYDGAGTEIWNENFNSLQNGNDQATAIALDTLGNVIVTGQNQISPITRVYTTVKYLEKNMMLPQDTIASISSSFVFTENRGQLYGTDAVQHPEIKYYTINTSPKIYFADTSISYVLAKDDTSALNYDTLARVDMKFVGANSGLKIRGNELTGSHKNFYNGVPGGREQVEDYNQLVSFSVWNNVDIVYGSNLKGFKYYFVCKPAGGSGSYVNIDLKYTGADSVKIDGSGQLIIYTKLGNIVQPKAAAWQLDGSGNYTSLGWQPSYNLVATNEVKFTGLGSYNTAYPLIFAIDWGNSSPASIQNLDWSTYIGGDAREDLVDLDVRQSDGCIFYCGMTLSANFPASPNAFQTSNMGGFDGVALKLDSACNYQLTTDWATYYGTGVSSFASYQYGTTGAISPNGNYFMGGRTTHFGGVDIAFPSSQPAGAFVDVTYGGGSQDAFFTEFDNTSGTLLWATFYGGGGGTFESVNDMAFDANGNLYALLIADTSTPRMIETGAYNNATKPGGMILKFDSSLARKWATCFSATNGTTERIVCDTATGDFFVTGSVKDTLFPVINPGGGAYMDSTLGGTMDAYIARFNSADTITWGTYLGGIAGTEVGGAIGVNNGELYVAGTTSSSNFPFYYNGAGYIDSSYNSGTDLFITRFKTSGQRTWATYYGGSSGETAGNFAFDLLGNVFLSGNTKSNNFPTLNPGNNIYYDGSFGGGTVDDVVLLNFDQQNLLKWSTYFGGLKGDHNTEGLGIYQNEWLYMCGWTETKSTDSPNFPITPLGGAYNQPTMPTAITNSFMCRFGLDPTFTVSINEPDQLHTADISGLFVYPNPGDGEFQVAINSESKDRKIEVYNTLGQLLQTVLIPDGTASQVISLNLKEQPTGVYFIVLKDESGLRSKKVIKQ
jgi:hypothetical protein